MPRLACVVEELEARQLMSATTNTLGLGNYQSGSSSDTPNYPNSPTNLDDSQYLPPQSTYSTGTQGSYDSTTYTLTDSSQSWTTNALQGMQIQTVVNNVLETATIASNTATTLTLAGTGWSAPPTGTVSYQIYQLATPNVSDDFDQVIQTNDWWSSLLWRYQGPEATNAIYPHPFVTQFNTSGNMAGLAVAYPSKLTITQDAATNSTNYDYFMANGSWDLTNFALNIAGVPFSSLGQVQVESYSDWGVTISYGDSTDRLYATMLQGSPYMYFTLDSTNEVQFSVNNQSYGTNTQVEFTDNGDGTAYFGVPTGDHMVYYGLFAVNGSTWSVANAGSSIATISSNGLGAASDKYFAVALLPPAFDPMNDPTSVPVIFNTFKAHAYAEVSRDGTNMGTYVNYTYSPSTNQVVTMFGADVKLHATTFSDNTQLVNTPLMALYPHQWKASPTGTGLGSEFNYGAANDFAKGLMKLYALEPNVTNPWTNNSNSTGFTTTLTHQGGLLPFLPPYTAGSMDSNPTPGIVPNFTDISSLNPASQVQMIEYTAFVSPPTLDPQLDGYGTGKVLLKYANLVAIADQLSNSPNVHPLDRPLMAVARDKLLNTLKLELARYMGASSFEGYQQFFQFLYYNQDWDTLIPYNAGYGAGQQINDHHFHYGYFLHAAAILAMYDPEFIQEASGDDNFSGLLEMMARDVANWDRQDPSSTDPVFPFLRNFAPYAGHSYASGHGAFASGNNQESSSEAMNFWTGMALLGEAFINAGIDSGVKMRDLGVSLYETEASNIDQYTFDVDGDIFPVGFVSPTLVDGQGHSLPLTMSAQNWDSGSHNALFFQSNYAEAPFSIDWFPTSAGSLYLGRHSGAKGTNSYVEQNWDYYAANVSALASNYPDFAYPVYPGTDWAYQALFDPAGALASYTNYWNAADISSRGNLGFDPGESAAMTLNWINVLSQYGYLDSSVTATGVSTYAAFRKTAGGQATYVAYNPSLNPVTVTFKDGASQIVMTVPAKTMAYQTGTSGSAALQPVGATEFGTSSGSNTSTTLNDTTQSWFAGQYDGLQVTITGGTGAGQTRLISGTSATALTITQPWATVPDSTSTYSITYPAPSILQQPQQVTMAGQVGSATASTLTDSTQNWTTNQFAGMQVAITYSTASAEGQIATIISNTATTLTLSGTTNWQTTPAQYDLYQISQPAPLGPQFYLSTGGLQNGVLTSTQPDDRTATDTTVTIPATVAAGFGTIPSSTDPNTAHFEITGLNLSLTNPNAANAAATSQFAIWLKDNLPSAAGANQIIAVAIRYKWNGTPASDSDWDRMEMFQTSGSQQNYVGSLAPDTNVPATFDLWNLYDSVRNPVAGANYIQDASGNPAGATVPWQSFVNGTIQVSVWLEAGGRATDVSLNSPEALGRQSFIALPSFYGSGLAFGSAPDSYQTSLSNDGARHVAINATIGGSVVTSPDASVGSATVDGADHGIFVASLVPGQSTYFLADIQNAVSGSTYLDAWIDFNGNGVFDSNERITAANGTAVSTGLNKITFTVPNGATAGQSYARFRVSSTGGLDPSGLAADGDIEDQIVWIDDSLPSVPKQVGIEGLYFVGGQQTSVTKSGNSLTFTNADGSNFYATLDNTGTHFTVNGSQVTGDFYEDSGFIGLSSGAVWEAVRQLAGSWILPLGNGGITQTGINLTLTNAAHQTVAASFINAQQISVPLWGVVGTLSREGTRIHFSNGKTWDMTPMLGSTFENASGAPVRVEQRGSELILVNRAGATSVGKFLNSHEIQATDWGSIVGQIEDGNIYWSNGTEWRRSVLSSSTTEVGGIWDVNGQNTRILQSANALTFVNRFGGTSAGHFVSANEVVATDWGGIHGVIVGTQLRWIGNGSVWSQVPDLNGARIDQAGRLTGIAQLERSLYFTDAAGNVSHGNLVGTNRVAETDGARRQGLISGNSLVWLSGGQIWNALPDLRGTWSVTTGGGAPSYIEQSGLTLLFIDRIGRTARGTFTSASSASMKYDDNQSTFNVAILDKKTLSFSDGALWQDVAPTDLDTVFADSSMWPFL